MSRGRRATTHATVHSDILGCCGADEPQVNSEAATGSSQGDEGDEAAHGEADTGEECFADHDSLIGTPAFEVRVSLSYRKDLPSSQLDRLPILPRGRLSAARPFIPRGDTMHRYLRRTLVCATVVAGVVLPAAPALAAPKPTSSETAILDCATDSYVVDGFGRGQALHVVDTTINYVVTSAQLADGTYICESPSQADRPEVACTTVTPEGRPISFTGFFTPIG
jgi:hypothetical protein